MGSQRDCRTRPARDQHGMRARPECRDPSAAGAVLAQETLPAATMHSSSTPVRRVRFPGQAHSGADSDRKILDRHRGAGPADRWRFSPRLGLYRPGAARSGQNDPGQPVLLRPRARRRTCALHDAAGRIELADARLRQPDGLFRGQRAARRDAVHPRIWRARARRPARTAQAGPARAQATPRHRDGARWHVRGPVGRLGTGVPRVHPCIAAVPNTPWWTAGSS